MGALIERHQKQRNGYNVPKHFETNWILFVSSDGSVIEEKYIRDNYTTIQVMERVLYKQIRTLKELESMQKE